MHRTLLLAPFALAACQNLDNVHVRHTPAYSEAIGMRDPREPRMPAVIVGEHAPPFGELVAYVTMTFVSPSSNQEVVARYLFDKSLKHMPDVVTVVHRQSVITGTTGAHVGWGVVMSWPTYQHVFDAVCWREAEGVLPFRTNDDGMIVELAESQRGAGLLEGDHVIAVAGCPVDFKKPAESPHLRAMLTIRSEGEVKIDAIRPGTGRIQATVRGGENPRTYLALPAMKMDPDIAIEPGREGGWRARYPEPAIPW